MGVTNKQLLSAIDSIDTRLTNVETILMGNPGRGNSKSLSPATVFIVKWVVFPLIVIIGSVVGVTIAIPGG